ncbi:hypothetical protein ABZY68_36635, partial [Streptomyces sp. NPDC006482]|uniref:hypothetical protein n=1 Tax=Streptomyces sp. NPDC006482 TaxID=3154306 RepID=UPI0033B4874B
MDEEPAVADVVMAFLGRVGDLARISRRVHQAGRWNVTGHSGCDGRSGSRGAWLQPELEAEGARVECGRAAVDG